MTRTFFPGNSVPGFNSFLGRFLNGISISLGKKQTILNARITRRGASFEGDPKNVRSTKKAVLGVVRPCSSAKASFSSRVRLLNKSAPIKSRFKSPPSFLTPPPKKTLPFIFSREKKGVEKRQKEKFKRWAQMRLPPPPPPPPFF